MHRTSVVLIIGLLAAFCTSGNAQEDRINIPLVLSVAVEKNEYVLYEPITFRFKLENKSDEPYPYDPSYFVFGESVGLWIRDSNANETGAGPMGIHTFNCRPTVDIRGVVPSIPPHGIVSTSGLVCCNEGTFRFPSTGKYTVTPKVGVGTLPSGAAVWMPDEPITIKIKDSHVPQSYSVQDIAEMLGDDLSVRDDPNKPTSRRRTPLEQARQRQEEFLVTYPDHPLAPPIQFALARSLIFENPRQPARAASLYLDYQKRYPNSWQADQALLEAAHAMAKDYKEKDAEKVLDTLEKTYPNSYLLERVQNLRHDLQIGAFVITNVHEERKDEEALKDQDQH